MKNIRIVAFLSLTILFCACAKTVDVDVEDAEAPLGFNFEGGCRGQGEVMTDTGTSTFVKDDSSGTCLVDMTWNGTIADLAGARADVEDDTDVDAVALEKVEVILKLVELQDRAGQTVREENQVEVTGFTGSLSIFDIAVYNISGTSTSGTTFQDILSDDGITVTFEGETNPMVVAFENMLDVGGPVTASAAGQLTFSSTTALQSRNPHAVLLQHDFRLSAGAVVLDD